MSDDSDDEFAMLATKTRGGSKGKGKGKAVAKPTSAKMDCFSLDSLLAQSEMEVERKEKIEVGLDMSAVDRIINQEFDTERDKQQLYAENARAERQEAQMLSNESITIPGTITVFLQPDEDEPAEVPFDAPCPRKHAAVLFKALRQSAGDPQDLEEILRGGLVPWVRQKLNGTAPVEVCRWLLRLVARHDSPRLVLAAEDALLNLLDEPCNEWKLRYRDSLEIYSACGATWLSESDGSTDKGLSLRSSSGHLAGRSEVERSDTDMDLDEEEDEDEDDEEEEDGEDDENDEGPVRRNLGPFLNIVARCVRMRAHEMTDSQLQEMLLDLLAAALDKRVCGSCQTEVYHALQAVLDATSREVLEDAKACSWLVERICDPGARKLESQMEKLSIVLLARNVPLKRATREGESDGRVSLRHEVCHRLLTKFYLKRTSYASEEISSTPPFARALKAMEVILDDEDDILEDDSFGGYERQFGVVALVNEMCAGALVVSETGCPEPGECKEMLAALGAMDKQLRNVMQRPVQMCKTLLDLMKSKLTPYAKEHVRQDNLSAFITSERDVIGNAHHQQGNRDKDGDGDEHFEMNDF